MINNFEKNCGTLVDGILNKLIGQNPEENIFYHTLWNKIIKKDSEFENEDEQIFALYKIWTDGRIPYFHLNTGIRMKNEEFMQILDDKIMEIKKSFFIINSQFEQRTEQSSLLLQILESCKNEKEKAVVLAQILHAVEKKTAREIMSR